MTDEMPHAHGRDRKPVDAISVRDLLVRRDGRVADQWHLALVQRAEAWDQVRMRYLLDSLLAGYPIGTLLVCQVKAQSQVIRLDDAHRDPTVADPSAWQLLDGQQRINALYSVFTRKGGYGRFYLDMTQPRPESHGPVTGRRARDAGLEYIRWTKDDERPPHRSRCIDLSGWFEWALGAGKELVDRFAVSPEEVDVAGVLHHLDAELDAALIGEHQAVARDRLAALVRMWSEPVIPVESSLLRSPMDVLEVFTRINRAGVQVAGEDLFFAAVKTLWPRAEPTVDAVCTELSPTGVSDPGRRLVTRMGTLRLLARLAATASPRGADLVPLAIDRLVGDRGAALVAVMEQLADPSREPLRRMKRAMQAIACRSSLGGALAGVDERLWDHVLGWAACNNALDAVLDASIHDIDAYLVGATAFKYPTVLRDKFARVAMHEALAAGAHGGLFPVHRILQVTRGSFQILAGGRERVASLETDEDRVALANRNAPLFLSIVQKIPLESAHLFAWDHIFPQAQADLMWCPGEPGYRCHHAKRPLVGSAGNFWALHTGANSALGKKLPREKFSDIDGFMRDLSYPIPPRAAWPLTEQDIAAFEAVGEVLSRKDVTAGDVDRAMDQFEEVTNRRSRAMVEEVLRLLPTVAQFSESAAVPRSDPGEMPDLVAALGIAVPEQSPKAVATRSGHGDAVRTVLDRAEEFGSGAGLREFIARMEALGLQVRGWSQSIGLTPRDTRRTVLINVRPVAGRGGDVQVWVAPSVFAAAHPDLPGERFESELGGIQGDYLTPSGIAALAVSIERLLTRAAG